MRKINIGLLGLGTVGSSVYKMIRDHQLQLQQQVGCSVEVNKILVRDLNKNRGQDIPFDILTTNPDDILVNDSIDIVIEVIGGINLAKEYTAKALENGKHVVTANKDMIAEYGAELLALAKNKGCDLFYEASVAGGIPIIRSLKDGLVSDKIKKIMGIVNGTTNFILTKMSQDGMRYENALQLAKDLGFAEPDPTSDVEGLDAARKILILAILGFSMQISLDDVYTEGISKVTKEDIEYTKQLGYTLKLIGLATRENGAVQVSVLPTLLPHSHPLASVNNEFNAVYVYGEAVGETMFYGPGAGGLPTATSIVSDLIAVIKNMNLGVNGQSIGKLHYEKHIMSDEQIFSKFFLRIEVRDEIGVFSKIANIFQKNQLSFENILQKPCKDCKDAEVIIITHKVSLKHFMNSIKALHELDEVLGIKSYYRVEE